MRKCFPAVLLVLACLAGTASAAVQHGDGRSHYYLGVFAHEDGAYQAAEEHLRAALDREPDNPYYQHYLGKTALKLRQYDEALSYLQAAWETDPDIPGLKVDLAATRFELRQFGPASELYVEVVAEDASNVLAAYNAGISLYREARYREAIDYLERAAAGSASVRDNAVYYAGVCYQRLGMLDEAIDKLEYVRDRAASASLRASAENALWAIKAQAREEQRLRLLAKLSFGYDDNVRLAPDIADGLGAGQGDYFFAGSLSGSYDLLRAGGFTLGAGYNHYQTAYTDLDEYDLVSATPNLYARYRARPFTFGLRYLPSFYWLDKDRYLTRHEVRPSVQWRLRKNLVTAATYAYQDEDYDQDDGRDGQAHLGSLDLAYNFGGRKNYLRVGGEFKDKSADAPDQEYEQWTARVGVSLGLPLGLGLGLKGRYYSKKYQAADPVFGFRRSDDYWEGAVSVEHRFFADWLGVVGEFTYVDNDSNIVVYDYVRRIGTLSLTARY